jgi:hypothetical protein
MDVAKTMAPQASVVCASSGIQTSVATCQRDAPSDLAASSSCASTFSILSCKFVIVFLFLFILSV